VTTPAFDHRTAGTAEPAWRRARRTVPLAPPLRTGDRVLVVAAHPDDETLGAGGLIAMAARVGVRVTVLVATDGEASHPRSTTHTRRQLAGIRRAEVQAAVGRLDARAELRFLGLPDGHLAEHLPLLTAAVADLAAGCSHVVTPWRSDGHPDHAASAAAAEVAISGQGSRPLHWQYPIWAWHWGDPDRDDLPWTALRRVILTGSARQAKLAAIREHASQHSPLSDRPGDEAILSPSLLEHFTGEDETFVVEPAAAPAAATAYFDDLYARSDDPWGLDTRFYERRKRDLLLASLPRERFRRVFEPGCASGLLTEALAGRAERVVAWDAAAAAVDLARGRLASIDRGVEITRGRIPEEWPDGEFDLVVVSEVGYYCRDLDQLQRRISGCLSADGTVIACHWRRPAQDHPQTAERVHAVLGRDLRPTVQHVEADFLLHVWARSDRSVAERDGLLT
jgi:LmbE family N-acetylglucosaminyl deacetylase/SAM-dependent methyltransferase